MAATLSDVRKLLPEVRRELLRKPNVVAVGVGYKRVRGKKTTDLSLVCSVAVKHSKATLAQSEQIPASIQSIPTDVNPTGHLHAQQAPTGRFRPAPGGVSIGHELITAGTLGCLVSKNGVVYILSNNHVLANSNAATPGDAILQPGPYDGGVQPEDIIARLSEFVPIQFQGGQSPCPIGSSIASFLNALASMVGSSTRLQAIVSQASENLVDAAIAKPIEPSMVKNEILNIGVPTGVAEGVLGMAIKKSGRTTGLTTGTIEQIDVSAQVSYGANQTALFVDQLLAGSMSEGGDSGSAVLDEGNKLVGLLFAGSTSTTIINRIQNVFQALGVGMVS